MAARLQTCEIFKRELIKLPFPDHDLNVVNARSQTCDCNWLIFTILLGHYLYKWILNGTEKWIIIGRKVYRGHSSQRPVRVVSNPVNVAGFIKLWLDAVLLGNNSTVSISFPFWASYFFSKGSSICTTS